MRAIQWISEKFKQVRGWFTLVRLIPANMSEHQRLKMEQKVREAQEKANKP
jgi:hypothetical protein